MEFDHREYFILYNSVLTRIQIFRDLVSQEKSRPKDQQGLLLGFESQLGELLALRDRLAAYDQGRRGV